MRKTALGAIAAAALTTAAQANACQILEHQARYNILRPPHLELNATTTCERARLLLRFYKEAGGQLLAAKTVHVDGYVIDTVIKIRKEPRLLLHTSTNTTEDPDAVWITTGFRTYEDQLRAYTRPRDTR